MKLLQHLDTHTALRTARQYTLQSCYLCEQDILFPIKETSTVLKVKKETYLNKNIHLFYFIIQKI